MTLLRFPAHDEYKRDPELRKSNVKELTDWTKSQLHLPAIEDEDAILFLTSCNHNVEQAKFTIDTFYTLRSNWPEFFHNRDPLEQISFDSMNTVTFIPLPGETDQGYKVIYIRLIDTDPSKYNFTNTIKCLMHFKDIMLYEEGAVKGVCFILDLQGVGLRHLARVNPLSLKKLLVYLQNAMPSRLRSINFVNPVFFMDSILSLIRPLLNQSTAKAIFVHNSLDDLFKIIPKRLIPSDVGGQLDASIKELQDASIKKVIDNRDWLLAEEKMRVQESLRPKSVAKSNGGIFGFNWAWPSRNKIIVRE